MERPNQYRPTPDQPNNSNQNQPSPEGEQGYVRNKEPLLALIEQIKQDPKRLTEKERKHVVAEYLDTVLKNHVYEMDPYWTMSPWSGDVSDAIYYRLERSASRLTQMVASNWLVRHPNSEAAKAVSVFGLYATPQEHQRLLQEVWPVYMPAIKAHVEKSE
jgi:hypothetical protein